MGGKTLDGKDPEQGVNVSSLCFYKEEVELVVKNGPHVPARMTLGVRYGRKLSNSCEPLI